MNEFLANKASLAFSSPPTTFHRPRTHMATLVPRSHLLLIVFVLLNFSKCNETHSKLQKSKLSDTILLHDSLVVPSAKNVEEEAKKLYDEALKQYGDLGKTLKEICEPWKEMGCACKGTLEEVELSCRGVSLSSVPNNLPVELIKL